MPDGVPVPVRASEASTSPERSQHHRHPLHAAIDHQRHSTGKILLSVVRIKLNEIIIILNRYTGFRCRRPSPADGSMCAYRRLWTARTGPGTGARPGARADAERGDAAPAPARRQSEPAQPRLAAAQPAGPGCPAEPGGCRRPFTTRATTSARMARMHGRAPGASVAALPSPMAIGRPPPWPPASRSTAWSPP